MAPSERRTPQAVIRALLVLAGAASVLAVVVSAGGGFAFTVGTVLVRAHKPWVLIGVAGAAAGLALWRAGFARIRVELSAAWDNRTRFAPWIAGATAAATMVVGLVWGTWTAGGSDSYGYVSEALLLSRGQLVVDEPIARDAPWPGAESTLAPLGYRAATSPGGIVPTYPPGLPLVMAVAARVGGTPAVFLIVPVAGMAAVWLTYLMGRWLLDATCGAMASILLASSPVFLYQVVQPMSDVPVTAWWLAAFVLVIRRRGALADSIAGTCAGMAMLTRPNLAPLALLLVLAVALRERHHAARLAGVVRRVAIFCGPLVVSVAVLLWLNQLWYGRPLSSGYGTFGELFSLSNIPTNLTRYPRWLWDTQTPFVYLGLAAPLVAWLASRRRDSKRTASDKQFVSAAPLLSTAAPMLSAAAPTLPATVPALLAVGFALLVFASYLAYSPFDEWWYLRFLLPGLPYLLAAGAFVSLWMADRLPRAARATVLALGVAALAAHQVNVAQAGHAFDLQAYEARYGDTGRFVARALDPRSVLLALQHSGSLRLYAGRQTLRFDAIEPAWLDRVVSHLTRAGYHPYFVLESWEEQQFRDRFASASVFGHLDWPMAADIRTATQIHVYDPADRARYAANKPVETILYRPNWTAGPSEIRTIHVVPPRL